VTRTNSIGRSNLSDKKGMSLVDAMLAMAVVLLGGLAFSTALIYSTQVSVGKGRRATLGILKNNFYAYLSNNNSFTATILYGPNQAAPANFACLNPAHGGGYTCPAIPAGTLQTFTVCVDSACNFTYPPVLPVVTNGFDDNATPCAGAPSAACPIQPVVSWTPRHLHLSTATGTDALIDVTVTFNVFSGTKASINPSRYNLKMIRFAPGPQ
jgi:hypothetical protein